VEKAMPLKSGSIIKNLILTVSLLIGVACSKKEPFENKVPINLDESKSAAKISSEDFKTLDAFYSFIKQHKDLDFEEMLALFENLQLDDQSSAQFKELFDMLGSTDKVVEMMEVFYRLKKDGIDIEELMELLKDTDLKGEDIETLKELQEKFGAEGGSIEDLTKPETIEGLKFFAKLQEEGIPFSVVKEVSKLFDKGFTVDDLQKLNELRGQGGDGFGSIEDLRSIDSEQLAQLEELTREDVVLLRRLLTQIDEKGITTEDIEKLKSKKTVAILNVVTYLENEGVDMAVLIDVLGSVDLDKINLSENQLKEVMSLIDKDGNFIIDTSLLKDPKILALLKQMVDLKNSGVDIEELIVALKDLGVLDNPELFIDALGSALGGLDDLNDAITKLGDFGPNLAWMKTHQTFNKSQLEGALMAQFPELNLEDITRLSKQMFFYDKSWAKGNEDGVLDKRELFIPGTLFSAVYSKNDFNDVAFFLIKSADAKALIMRHLKQHAIIYQGDYSQNLTNKRRNLETFMVSTKILLLDRIYNTKGNLNQLDQDVMNVFGLESICQNIPKCGEKYAELFIQDKNLLGAGIAGAEAPTVGAGNRNMDPTTIIAANLLLDLSYVVERKRQFDQKVANRGAVVEVAATSQNSRTIEQELSHLYPDLGSTFFTEEDGKTPVEEFWKIIGKADGELSKGKKKYRKDDKIDAMEYLKMFRLVLISEIVMNQTDLNKDGYLTREEMKPFFDSRDVKEKDQKKFFSKEAGQKLTFGRTLRVLIKFGRLRKVSRFDSFGLFLRFYWQRKDVFAAPE
jgi:hypothetical protein